MKPLPRSPLWRVSVVMTALVAGLLLVVEIVFGFDWFTAFILLLAIFSLLGVWRESGAGKWFLNLLIVFELVLMVPAIIATFGMSALSGQGFDAPMRLFVILMSALVMTALPLGTYTAYLNQTGRDRRGQTSQPLSQNSGTPL